MALWVLTICTDAFASSSSTLSHYLQGASLTLKHNFLLSEEALGQLTLSDRPGAGKSLEEVDQVLDALGLVRIELNQSSSRIQPGSNAQLSLGTLQVDAEPMSARWGLGLDDDARNDRLIRSEDASIDPLATVADLTLQTANVYGSGARIYFRGVSRSFGVDQTQNASVILAEQALPDYLAETLALPVSGNSTSVLRRGAEFGFSGNANPSYAGSIRTSLQCNSGRPRTRLFGTIGDDKLHNFTLSSVTDLVEEELSVCADFSAASAEVPVFSTGRTARDEHAQSLQTRLSWAPASAPNLLANLSLARLDNDLDDLSLNLSDGLPLGESSLRFFGLRKAQSDGTLLSAEMVGEYARSSWRFQAGALDSKSRTTVANNGSPNALNFDDARYQASLQSLHRVGRHTILGLSVGAVRSRSSDQSVLVSDLANSPEFGPELNLFRLLGTATRRFETGNALANQHRYLAIRYEVNRENWQLSASARYDDYRLDQELRSEFSLDISADCLVELVVENSMGEQESCTDYFQFLEPTGSSTPNRVRSGRWTRQVALQRKLSPNLVAGLQYYEGFRPAGALLGASQDTIVALPYEEELARTTEAQLTYRWGTDSYLSFNAFSTRFVDQQINPTAEEFFATGQLFIRNSGRSKSRGAEIEGNWAFTPGNTLSWSVGYLSTKYLSYVPIELGFNGLDVSGNQFPGAPRWSGSAQWKFQLLDSVQFRLLFVGADEAFADARNLANRRSPSFGRFDASVTKTWGNLSATAFVENLNDEQYLLTTLQPGVRSSTLQPARGRTIGLTVGYEF